MQEDNQVKTTQQVNNEIPLNDWELFEDLYLEEKRKDPSRKLNKKDFFIQVFKKGVENWTK